MNEEINTPGLLGETVLYEAVSDQDINEVRRLLSLGADPNIPEVNGITPLMEAAIDGNMDIVDLLLANGADLYVLDNFGTSTIDWAHESVATVLQSLVDPARLRSVVEAYEEQIAERKRKVAKIVANLPETRNIDVFYVFRDGEFVGIAETEDRAQKLYKEEPGCSLSFDVKQEVVGMIDGTLRNFGDEEDPYLPHVIWDCPACGITHTTDLNEDDPNPALWYCEMGFGDAKFLIRWHPEKPS